MALEITITYGPNAEGAWILDVDAQGLPPLLAKAMVEEAQTILESVDVEEDDGEEAEVED